MHALHFKEWVIFSPKYWTKDKGSLNFSKIKSPSGHTLHALIKYSNVSFFYQKQTDSF